MCIQPIPKKPYRIPKDELPCKFASEWWEDVAGDGGSRMHMFECTCDKNLTEEEQAWMDKLSKCCPECAGYEPVTTMICQKHDIEFFDECIKCMDEFYTALEEAAKRWKNGK